MIGQFYSFLFLCNHSFCNNLSAKKGKKVLLCYINVLQSFVCFAYSHYAISQSFRDFIPDIHIEEVKLLLCISNIYYFNLMGSLGATKICSSLKPSGVSCRGIVCRLLGAPSRRIRGFSFCRQIDQHCSIQHHYWKNHNSCKDWSCLRYIVICHPSY